jgi:hypothetical protein
VEVDGFDLGVRGEERRHPVVAVLVDDDEAEATMCLRGEGAEQ